MLKLASSKLLHCSLLLNKIFQNSGQCFQSLYATVTIYLKYEISVLEGYEKQIDVQSLMNILILNHQNHKQVYYSLGLKFDYFILSLFNFCLYFWKCDYTNLVQTTLDPCTINVNFLIKNTFYYFTSEQHFTNWKHE